MLSHLLRTFLRYRCFRLSNFDEVDNERAVIGVTTSVGDSVAKALPAICSSS